MIKIERHTVPNPVCLDVNAEKWTNEFIERRKADNSYWNWHTYDNEKVDHILKEILSNLSKSYCTYCGVWTGKKFHNPSIDHFKPKSKFPELSFSWSNLFYSCGDCQTIKGSKYPKDIITIKPDALDYEFDSWFEFSFKTFEVIPKITLCNEDKIIAQETINWLGLNDGVRPKARKREFENYRKTKDEDLDNWSYPFLLRLA